MNLAIERYLGPKCTNLEHLRFISNLGFCGVDQGGLDDEGTVKVAPASRGILCRDGCSESSESNDVLHDYWRSRTREGGY